MVLVRKTSVWFVKATSAHYPNSCGRLKIETLIFVSSSHLHSLACYFPLSLSPWMCLDCTQMDTPQMTSCSSGKEKTRLWRAWTSWSYLSSPLWIFAWCQRKSGSLQVTLKNVPPFLIRLWVSTWSVNTSASVTTASVSISEYVIVTVGNLIILDYIWVMQKHNFLFGAADCRWPFPHICKMWADIKKQKKEKKKTEWDQDIKHWLTHPSLQ